MEVLIEVVVEYFNEMGPMFDFGQLQAYVKKWKAAGYVDLFKPEPANRGNSSPLANAELLAELRGTMQQQTAEEIDALKNGFEYIRPKILLQPHMNVPTMGPSCPGRRAVFSQQKEV